MINPSLNFMLPGFRTLLTINTHLVFLVNKYSMEYLRLAKL